VAPPHALARPARAAADRGRPAVLADAAEHQQRAGVRHWTPAHGRSHPHRVGQRHAATHARGQRGQRALGHGAAGAGGCERPRARRPGAGRAGHRQAERPGAALARLARRRPGGAGAERRHG